MPTVLRDSKKPQGIAMSSLILPRVSRRTSKLRKKTATNNNQMSGLPDFLSNSRHRYLRRCLHRFTSTDWWMFSLLKMAPFRLTNATLVTRTTRQQATVLFARAFCAHLVFNTTNASRLQDVIEMF